MQQKLTESEIVRVFAMYYGCEYEFLNKIEGKPDCRRVSGYTLDNINSHGIEDRKLILKGLSAITDEHAIEVAKMMVHEYALRDMDENAKTDTGKSWIKNHFKDLRWSVHHYLIQKGYAVPIYFGIDHPCNGSTAIDLNIAVDKNLNND